MGDTHSRFDFDHEIDRREVPALKLHQMVLGEDGADLFAAGVADMDFTAPPAVLEALGRRLAHGVFGYEAFPAGLLPALRDWCARRHNWQVDEAHILRSPNVLNALAMAANLFTKEGEGIIVQPPVFFDFFDVIRENKRRVVHNPLLLRGGRYYMDFEDFEAKAAAPDVRMLLLCNPHNPVGRVWTATELRTLGDICARYGVLVVSDEMHGDLVYPGSRFTPFAALGPTYAENSIICTSPAKTFNIASCSSAFTVVARADRRRAFEAENSRLTVNKNNAFANVAMLAAFEHGDAWLAAVLDYLHANLSLARERLAAMPKVQMIEPEATFLIWLDFRALNLQPEELMAFLRNQARWAVTRGVAFGTGGAGFVRVNIACTRARLSAALDTLERALTGAQQR